MTAPEAAAADDQGGGASPATAGPGTAIGEDAGTGASPMADGSRAGTIRDDDGGASPMADGSRAGTTGDDGAASPMAVRPDAGISKSSVTAGAERRPATDAERRALASVVRLRILRMCLYEPLTNRQLADRLHMNPATTLHHVRTLADLGFLVAGEVRRGRRGAREIPYRATRKSWTLDMGDSAELPGERLTLLKTFLAEVAEVPPDKVATIRLGLQLSADHEKEFHERLAGLLNEFARRPHDPDGARWSVFVAIHPEP